MNRIIKNLMIVGFVTFCLNAEAQIKVGAKGGVNLSNVAFDYKDSDFETATKMKVGFHIGAAVEAEFSDELALQTGLLFSNKGAGIDLEDDLEEGQTVDGSSSISLNYIDIPIHIAYKMDQFQIYAGPYLGFSMGGKNKNDYTSSITVGGMTFETEVTDDFDIKPIFGDIEEGDLGDDETGVSALDYGFDIGIGYMVSDALLLNAGYSLGLANLTPGIDGLDEFDKADFKQANRVISISASYFFGQ